MQGAKITTTPLDQIVGKQKAINPDLFTSHDRWQNDCSISRRNEIEIHDDRSDSANPRKIPGCKASPARPESSYARHWVLSFTIGKRLGGYRIDCPKGAVRRLEHRAEIHRKFW